MNNFFFFLGGGRNEGVVQRVRRVGWVGVSEFGC